MISVIVPTFNAAQTLPSTLSALIPAVVEGLVREVIIVDGGSTDATLKIAEASGADVVRSEPGRAQQLRTGADRARFPWLLFLHADTVLEGGWEREAAAFLDRIEEGRRPPTAAAFRFALDDVGTMPRLLELGVATRCALWGLPHGEQGLLISRQMYSAVGGFRPAPILEDVDLVRRLGRRRIVVLRSRALTSPIPYRRDGYAARVAHNLSCLALFHLRVPPRRIAQICRQRAP